jgi:cytidyltransferase-like protein
MSLENFLKNISPGKKITLVTGVFDVLHQEHQKFLAAAAQLGDYLLVGIETDKRVKSLKGEGRPINSQEKRKENLEKLAIADLLFILPEKFSDRSDYQLLLEKINPDYLAVSENSPFLDVKKELIEAVGGELKIVLAHNPEISSTKIINSRQSLVK